MRRPPFYKFVVTLMVGVRNCLAELFVAPWAADILRWTSSDNLEKEGIIEASGSRKGGLSQIFALNGMLTVGGEISAPNVVERTDDSECYCRKAEAAVEG
ncbi:hypothetical protein ACVIKO_000022 [Rhizobium ruizarguesonis]